MSTFTVQGTVTEIKGYQDALDHPQYGKSNKFYFNLDNGETYSLMGKKSSPTGKGPDGKAQAFGIGAQLMVFYTQNNNNGKVYNNTKSGQITVINPGQVAPVCGEAGFNAPQAQQGAQASFQGGASPTPQASVQSPASGAYKGVKKEYAIGRWVNCATQLVAAGKADSLVDGMKQAAKLEVYGEQNFKSLLDEAEAALNGGNGTNPAPAPDAPVAAAKSAVPVSTEDFDDQIPF